MEKMISIIFLFLALSCTSSVQDMKKNLERTNDGSHPEMANGYLVPRLGHEGFLTHQNGKKEIKRYELNKEFLKKAQIFRIACLVAGTRYRICKDKLGLCRSERVKIRIKRKGFWKFLLGEYREKEQIKSLFIPFSNYKILVEAGTYCRVGL